MRSVEEKPTSASSSINFEFHKQSRSDRAAGLGKTKGTPSKWDDAQKWLVGLATDTGNSSTKASKPRDSNASETHLIGHDNGYLSGEVETKNVDCEESYWQANKTVDTASLGVRSVCVRDMGTEMTPIASQEPSRSATPIRATTPVRRSPSASPETDTAVLNGDAGNPSRVVVEGNEDVELAKKKDPLEMRAMAWDEAERAKYMARFKREEVKIQAWENHEKRKAEMEMKKMEVKAERLKARAQEKYANKVAATRRIAEEKRAYAEAKLNEKAVKTSEKADYIRRTGHLPSNLFKLVSVCW